jgi:hypothetical protein
MHLLWRRDAEHLDLDKLKRRCWGCSDLGYSIPVGTVEKFDQLLDTIGVEHEIVSIRLGHAFFMT